MGLLAAANDSADPIQSTGWAVIANIIDSSLDRFALAKVWLPLLLQRNIGSSAFCRTWQASARIPVTTFATIHR
jgi:hypothetical protein